MPESVCKGSEMSEWRPIETANTSQLFASSTWVLVATTEGRVTEAMPLYVDGGGYIWIAARGDNLKGNTGGDYLRHSATHWMPLPSPPQNAEKL
jgi:hypothetical protein